MRSRLLNLLILPATLLVSTVLLAQAPDADRKVEAEFHMARMVYANGGASGRGRFGFRRGWWAIDYPSAEYHFTRGVRRLSNINVAVASIKRMIHARRPITKVSSHI